MIFIPPSFLSGLICGGKLKKSLGYTQLYSSGEINRDGPQISLKHRVDYLVQGNRVQDSIANMHRFWTLNVVYTHLPEQLCVVDKTDFIGSFAKKVEYIRINIKM